MRLLPDPRKPGAGRSDAQGAPAAVDRRRRVRGVGERKASAPRAPDAPRPARRRCRRRSGQGRRRAAAPLPAASAAAGFGAAQQAGGLQPGGGESGNVAGCQFSGCGAAAMSGGASGSGSSLSGIEDRRSPPVSGSGSSRWDGLAAQQRVHLLARERLVFEQPFGDCTQIVFMLAEHPARRALGVVDEFADLIVDEFRRRARKRGAAAPPSGRGTLRPGYRHSAAAPRARSFPHR